ncbi:MAG TPA: hypothetical protein VIL85_01800 [Thermomicrobiales bacterium]
MTKKPRAYAGQALVEYLWVIVVIALVCIPAMMFLNEAQENMFADHQDGLNAPSLVTASVDSAYNVPTSAKECKKDGWKTFVTPDGTFKNQGDCQSWVVTNGRNAPANP